MGGPDEEVPCHICGGSGSERDNCLKVTPEEEPAPSKKFYEKCTQCGYVLNVHEGVQDGNGD